MNQNLAIKVYSKVGKLIFERSLDISTEPVTHCGVQKLSNLTILDLKKFLNSKIKNFIDSTLEEVAVSSVIFEDQETQDAHITAALMEVIENSSVFGSLLKRFYRKRFVFDSCATVTGMVITGLNIK